MNTLLFLVACVASAPGAATAPVAEKALVMPIRASSLASRDAPTLPGALEDGLVRALVRHASFQVLRRSDIAKALGEAAQAQLMGCDEEACLARVAGELGARLLISAQLDRSSNGWFLQASLLDRVSAQAVRRSEARSRTTEGLFLSLDQVARELAGGSTLALADPQLATRLGTTREAVLVLEEESTRQPSRPLQDVWTDLVIARNKEADALPLLQAGLLLAGSSVIVVGYAASATVAIYASYASIGRSRRSVQTALSLGDPAPGEQFELSLGQLAGTVLAPAFAILAIPLVGAAIAVGVIDALDIGRLPVGREGCCRDEQRLRAATAPSWRLRAAEVVTIAAGALAMLSVLLGTVASVVLGTVFGVAYAQSVASGRALALPTGPSITLDFWPAATLALLGVAASPLYYGALLGVGIVSLVTALAMIGHERVALVDDSAPSTTANPPRAPSSPATGK